MLVALKDGTTSSNNSNDLTELFIVVPPFITYYSSAEPLYLQQLKRDFFFHLLTKAQYEKTVKNALMEVSNTLVLQQKLITVREEQAKAVDFLRKATKLSIDRYVRGLARYTDVLDAQQQLFPAENDLAQADRDRLLAMVQLFKALGGAVDGRTSYHHLKPHSPKSSKNYGGFFPCNFPFYLVRVPVNV